MKKKKEKVVWYDDGRTVADMSGVTGGFRPAKKPEGSSGFKEKWNTYWSATKMMLIPTLVAAAAMGLIYLIITVLFTVM